jgi:hypothetical protein
MPERFDDLGNFIGALDDRRGMCFTRYLDGYRAWHLG